MAEYSSQTDNRILLVEVQDNPMAKMAETGFQDIWKWVSAPSGWRPGQPLPDAAVALDAVIVFSRLYEEQATKKLCETILADPRFKGIPVLVAINQYQMPLANRVKELENGGFLFAPVREADLLERLG